MEMKQDGVNGIYRMYRSLYLLRRIILIFKGGTKNDNKRLGVRSMSKEKEVLIHVRECTKCKRYWSCTGKIKGTMCVYY